MRAVKFLMLVVGLISSISVWAKPGIVTSELSPRYTGENRITEEDMRVKIPGGYFRVTRAWTANGWEWNRRLADLEFYAITKPGQTCSSDGVSVTGETCTPTEDVKVVFGIKRGDEPYSWGAHSVHKRYCVTQGQTGSGSTQNYDCNNKTFASNGSKKITTDGVNGYEWSDRQGNLISYDQEGRVNYYQDKNGVRVNINRHPDGRISYVTDNNGELVVSFYYEHPNHEKWLTKIVDYTGREVVYNYLDEAVADGQYPQLVNITDVRGQTWLYEYSDRILAARIDPENNRTTYKFSKKGLLEGYANADGVGVSYEREYDSENETYIQRTIQTDGKVTEIWRNKLGKIVRKDVNGETQLTARYVLNTGNPNISEAVNWRVSGVGTQAELTRSITPVPSTPSSSSGSSSPGTSGTGAVSYSDPTYYGPDYVKYKWEDSLSEGRIATTYDDRGNKIRQVKGDSDETWEYDSKYNLVTLHRDAKYVSTKYEYYDDGNLLRKTSALGTDKESIVEYTYWPDGKLRTQTYLGDSNPETLTLEATYQYFYDSRGNLIRTIDPGLYEVEYKDYDVNGNAWTIIDQRDKPWLFEYDAVGNLTKETSPLLLSTSHHYDKAGRYDQHLAANGIAETNITPNANGMPLQITDHYGHSRVMGYDAGYRISSVKDANNNLNTFIYDAQGRIDKVIDGEQNLTDYEYKDGLLDSVIYPTFVETYGYDRRKRVDSRTLEANGVVQKRSWAFNAASERISELDAEQKPTITEYDEYSRIKRTLDANGGETFYGYDDRGNLIYVQDPEQRTTRYTYNALDQLASEAMPLGQTRSYDYWGNGLQKSITHRDGSVTYFTYDDDSRLQNTYYYDSVADYLADTNNVQASRQVSYTYHALGGIESYVDRARTALPNGATPATYEISSSATYGYNEIGQLEAVTVNYGPFSKTYRYTYYPNGQIKTYTNPEQANSATPQPYTYQYNGNGYITSINIPGEGQIAYSSYIWLLNDRIDLPGGAHIEKTPDGFMRYRTNRLVDPASNSLFDAAYVYDLENNITEITSSAGNESYRYDDLYRVTDALQPSASETYLYDKVGNRTAHNGTVENWEYNDNNQLISRPGFSYVYNDNGHLERRTEGSTVTEFLYNHEERLDKVIQNGTEIASYYYDPFGRRLWKQVNGVRRYFLYNQGGMVGEYDASGNLIQEYHYKPGRPWGTDPVFTRVAGKIYYYLNDFRLAPLRLVDKAGKVVWAAEYATFGEAIEKPAAIANPLRLPGQYSDVETGLYYNYYRDYDPSIGRYVQSDPIGLRGGINTYGYAYQNPLIYTDPTGEIAAVLPGLGMGLLTGLAVCALIPQCAQNLSNAIDSIVQESRKKGGTRSDPVSLPIVNPGRDCEGNCNPCPPGAEWWVDAPGHGHENGYWHKIVYNQDPKTCTCYPDRPSRGLEGN